MRQMPSWSYSVRLTAEPASASRAREFVCLNLLRHDLQHVQDDLRLVVSELVTNAITHAETPFTVVLQREGPLVTLIVWDLSPLVPVMAAGEAMDGGGRGLVIVDVLSRDWGVTSRPDGSKSVWAAFAADPDLVAAS
jgi:anti-sigma regulatory factor (Ser/Thr protein kinase)